MQEPVDTCNNHLVTKLAIVSLVRIENCAPLYIDLFILGHKLMAVWYKAPDLRSKGSRINFLILGSAKEEKISVYVKVQKFSYHVTLHEYRSD